MFVFKEHCRRLEGFFEHLLHPAFFHRHEFWLLGQVLIKIFFAVFIVLLLVGGCVLLVESLGKGLWLEGRSLLDTGDGDLLGLPGRLLHAALSDDFWNVEHLRLNPWLLGLGLGLFKFLKVHNMLICLAHLGIGYDRMDFIQFVSQSLLFVAVRKRYTDADIELHNFVFGAIEEE